MEENKETMEMYEETNEFDTNEVDEDIERESGIDAKTAALIGGAAAAGTIFVGRQLWKGAKWLIGKGKAAYDKHEEQKKSKETEGGKTKVVESTEVIDVDFVETDK